MPSASAAALGLSLGLCVVALAACCAQASSPARVLEGPRGVAHNVDATDAPYYAGQLAQFDAYFGKSTHTLPPVTEAVVVGGTVRTMSTLGDTAIPPGGYVLSAADTWLSDNLRVGDSVNVRLADGMEQASTIAHHLSGTNLERGTDMLVVYTQRPGRKSTGTNEWGLEAVVSPLPSQGAGLALTGQISAVGGNNSPVPPGGFVLSGHGEAAEWLAGAASVGARVDVVGAQVSITTDPASWLALARLAAGRLEAGARAMPSSLPSVDERLAAVRQLITTAEAALAGGKARDAVDAAVRARDLAVCSLPLTKPSPPDEVRGVWARTTEESPDEIRQSLDALASAHVNLVLPEVFYGGETLYPSTLTDQLPQFSGWDPLAIWVKEAHARGIAVHAWVHVFNWGESGPGPLLESHPDWAAVQKDGSLESTLEPGLFYADPAHPGVRDFMSALIAEMTSKYDLDGVELDYVRYPSSSTPDYSFSYSDYSRQAFKTAFGADPADLTPKDKLWAKWTAWRQGQVTEFVARLRAEMRASHPLMTLSAAVFPDAADAKGDKMQDWLSWVQQGLVDFVSPMVYSTDSVWVASTTKAVAAKAGATHLVPGIAPYLGMGTEALLDQIDVMRSAGAKGVAMFALPSLRGGQLGVLAAGPFSAVATIR